MIGKLIRMERIMDRGSGKTVIVPMDHGTTMGPIAGLEDMRETVDRMVRGGASSIVLHKGIVAAGHRGSGKDVGLIVHLSGSTSMSPDPNRKVPVCTVEESIQLGADAVSVHVNLGAQTEAEMLEHLGHVSRTCRDWGMPLLAMMYTRGEKVTDPYDVAFVKHAARVGAEMGADIVKVNYTGSADTFRDVVKGCLVPVVIAGGEKMDSDEDILGMVEGALAAGAAGVSIGRNVFQHEKPELIVRAIGAMVTRGASIKEAQKILRGSSVALARQATRTSKSPLKGRG